MTEIEVVSLKNKTICKVDIELNQTIKDLKRAIEKQVASLKVCRQSIRSSPSGKDIKNSVILASLATNKVYVKDLGPQIAWKTVFLAEYTGPIIIYTLFVFQPKLVYGDHEWWLSNKALVAMLCWNAHYIKRLIETIYVHRFSSQTMPLMNLFKNCGYYWGFAALISYHINHPLYTDAPSRIFSVGLVLFLYGEIGNLSAHLLLRNLRPEGSAVRKIPKPDSNPFNYMFRYVSCANYTYEFFSWIGFGLLSFCVVSFAFATVGFVQMAIWARQKHRSYKQEFKNYPSKRTAILPFIL